MNRTVYELTVRVSMVVEGDHNPALIASDVAAALQSLSPKTERGEAVHFDPVPHVTSAVTFKRQGRGWKKVEA